MADFSALKTGGPIAAVEAGDLRKVWEVMAKLGASHDADSQTTVGISVQVLAEACAPDANVDAVAARCLLLQVLAHQGLLAPWQHGGQLDDAVFDAAAKLPIHSIQQVDPELFLRQLRERLG